MHTESFFDSTFALAQFVNNSEILQKQKTHDQQTAYSGRIFLKLEKKGNNSHLSCVEKISFWDWIKSLFGFVSYDLKDIVEFLNSNNNLITQEVTSLLSSKYTRYKEKRENSIFHIFHRTFPELHGAKKTDPFSINILCIFAANLKLNKNNLKSINTLDITELEHAVQLVSENIQKFQLEYQESIKVIITRAKTDIIELKGDIGSAIPKLEPKSRDAAKAAQSNAILYNPVEEQDDGNCLLRAILDALSSQKNGKFEQWEQRHNIRHPINENHYLLRSYIAEYLERTTDNDIIQTCVSAADAYNEKLVKEMKEEISLLNIFGESDTEKITDAEKQQCLDTIQVILTDLEGHENLRDSAQKIIEETKILLSTYRDRYITQNKKIIGLDILSKVIAITERAIWGEDISSVKDSYVQLTKIDNFFCDMPHMFAIQKLFQVNIKIHSCDSGRFEDVPKKIDVTKDGYYPIGNTYPNTIHLIYRGTVNNKNHYDVYLPIKNI